MVLPQDHALYINGEVHNNVQRPLIHHFDSSSQQLTTLLDSAYPSFFQLSGSTTHLPPRPIFWAMSGLLSRSAYGGRDSRRIAVFVVVVVKVVKVVTQLRRRRRRKRNHRRKRRFCGRSGRGTVPRGGRACGAISSSDDICRRNTCGVCTRAG